MKSSIDNEGHLGLIWPAVTLFALNENNRIPSFAFVLIRHVIQYYTASCTENDRMSPLKMTRHRDMRCCSIAGEEHFAASQQTLPRRYLIWTFGLDLAMSVNLSRRTDLCAYLFTLPYVAIDIQPCNIPSQTAVSPQSSLPHKWFFEIFQGLPRQSEGDTACVWRYELTPQGLDNYGIVIINITWFHI